MNLQGFSAHSPKSRLWRPWSPQRGCRAAPGIPDLELGPKHRCARCFPTDRTGFGRCPRVATRAAVAQGDVLHAVGPEGKLATIVVAKRLGDLKHHQLTFRHLHTIALGKSRDHRPALASGRVVNVEMAVGLEFGVEDQTPKALLVSGGAHPASDVQENSRFRRLKRTGEGHHPSNLLRHEQPIARLNQVGQPAEAQA